MKTCTKIDEIKNKCLNLNPLNMSKIHSLLLKKVSSLEKYPLKDHQYNKYEMPITQDEMDKLLGV